MAINISKYSLRLIKEEGSRYDFIDRKMSDPSKVADVFREVFEMDERAVEIFVIMTLDTKNKINGVFKISEGTLNASIVHPRDVFQRALLQNANAIILGHNHPSGDPTPSNDDINITDRLVEAGKLMGIKVLDHVIIGEDKYYMSFKEKNMI